MNPRRKKRLFNLAGSLVILAWLLAMGRLLIAQKPGGALPAEPVAIAAPRALEARRDWMEVYLQGKKIGYSQTRVSPAGEDLQIVQELYLKMLLLGQPSVVRSTTDSVVSRDLRLKQFSFRLSSGAVSFEAGGQVEGNRLILRHRSGGHEKEETLELRRPPMLSASLGLFFEGRTLRPGEAFIFPVFDPSAMAQREVTVSVHGREELSIHGTRHAAFRLEGELWGQPLTLWVDEQGRLLKEEGLLGLTLVRSDAQRALREFRAADGADWYDLAAVPLDRPLIEPERMTQLRVRLKGLAETGFATQVLNSGRQKLDRGVLEIRRERLPERGEPAPPEREPAQAAYLAPELHLESDAPAMIQQAAEITAGTAHPVAAAGALLDWVYRNVEKKPLVSVPSALEVLRTREGDCNEHAVLLTALLRAAAIPARVCAGLVHARGKFFYHAWTEAFLGNPEKSAAQGSGAAEAVETDGWISMDATLNQMPADPSHIKLAEGGLDKQAEILRLIGRLKIELVGFSHD